MERSRRQRALDIRVAAAEMAFGRYHPPHQSNGDEQRFAGEGKYLANFTKGLPHEYDTGLLQNPEHFLLFVKGIESGNPNDFINIPLGPSGNSHNPVWEAPQNEGRPVRAWESQAAGNLFALEGVDAQAVTMPPAPSLGSHELSAEMAEVYLQALLRDTPFDTMMDRDLGVQVGANSDLVEAQISKLNGLPWFSGAAVFDISPHALNRRRGPLALDCVFRGVTNGDNVGPYISQFLLAGSGALGGQRRHQLNQPEDGYIAYGSIRIDQRVRTAEPGRDYMETWAEWIDVQNGINLDQQGMYLDHPAYRFIATPRDLATYVHNDALYEAYLNACLLMLDAKVPLDEGIPFTGSDAEDKQQGFAHFGPPHILTLVTEVATRALKAVRYQKFNVHRRLRPEALAGRLEKLEQLPMARDELGAMFSQLQNVGVYGGCGNLASLDGVGRGSRLLPMAFREGSPMHPSYGAGHATVAGACVTILKAFFDHRHILNLTGEGEHRAFVAKPDGSGLNRVSLNAGLTVEGELNKLASNISIGRNWAGVHYFSDYIESVRMGERIALAVLQEQKLTYQENFSMTVPLFDGGFATI